MSAQLASRSSQSAFPALRVSVTSEQWLANKIAYVKNEPRSEFGVPYMSSSITAWFEKGCTVFISVDELSKLKDMRGEQKLVRYGDLAAIKKIMSSGRLPLGSDGQEYAPFIRVGYDGVPWIAEGNHRIRAAKELGYNYLPVEITWADGGERVAGKWAPDILLSKHIELTHHERMTYPVVARSDDKSGHLPVKYSVNVVFNEPENNDKSGLIFKDRHVGYMEWKELSSGPGVCFVQASHFDREMFGKGTYRIGKDEMHAEHIVKIDPKGMKLYFVDNEHMLLTDQIRWEDPVKLSRLIINDKAMFESAFDEVRSVDRANDEDSSSPSF